MIKEILEKYKFIYFEINTHDDIKNIKRVIEEEKIQLYMHNYNYIRKEENVSNFTFRISYVSNDRLKVYISKEKYQNNDRINWIELYRNYKLSKLLK